ncbi:hypothetical protein [Synechococcus sp. BS55D]|uniref:hypothetical protein n=1 Tax=Synechococcus sp. BS55D TaxID=2055943 RepID=UPI001038EF9B|nr:hypothetical protein [Synechococcus sp. BS55D]TCD57011.1 hypothetical protein CWE16_04190 [Synechococcus sp. BS55D]
MKRTLWHLLIGAAGLAIVQQQFLLRQPPHLETIAPAPVHSAAAAIDLRFSRPMRIESVLQDSRLQPDRPHRFQGEQRLLRLLLDLEQPLRQPLRLQLGGDDNRGLPLPTTVWWWDPRPHLLVVARTRQGEQLRLRRHDGTWMPLSGLHPRILQVEPLGQGAGVAYVSADAQGYQQGWLQRLQPRSLVPALKRPSFPVRGQTIPLTAPAQMFVHLSADRQGDLLIQTGGQEPGSDQISLLERKGRRRLLDVKPSGTMQLLPSGGAVVLPTDNGLALASLEALQSADGGTERRQLLPGSRDLRAFCSGAGRAVLVRHWPDYRRSLELVIPSQTPRQLWLGEQAVMAASCDAMGTRIWMVLREGGVMSTDTLLQLDQQGQVTGRRSLAPWSLESGTSLGFDPVGQQLLLTLRKGVEGVAQPALISLPGLQLTVLDSPVAVARWLP